MPNGVSYYLGPPGPNGFSDDPSYHGRRDPRDGWYGPTASLDDVSDEQWNHAGYSVVDTGYELSRAETRELVLSLYDLGASYSKISRLTDVSRRTVKRWIMASCKDADHQDPIVMEQL